MEKNIYKKTGKPYRSDYDLVVDYQDTKNKDALYELWDKYFLLRQKKKFELRSIAVKNGFNVTEELEGWEMDAWEKFFKQMDSIDRTKIKSPETWKIYIRLNGYWNSMNRDILHGRIKKFKHEIEDNVLRGNTNSNDYDTDRFYQYTEDYNKDFYRSVFNEALKVTYSGLDKKQQKIFDMKSQKFSIKEISEKMKTTPDIVKFNIKATKQIFSNNIEKISTEQFGHRITYDEMVNSLKF